MKFPKIILFFFLFELCLISRGSVASSLDNWHWRNPLPNGNPPVGPHTLHAITYGDGKFIGVGDSGTVSISTDTTNWTELPTATSNKLNAIIFTNNLFVAVGDFGTVETSVEGTNWVLKNSGTAQSLSGITYGQNQYLIIGAAEVLISSDASSWAICSTNSFGAVAYGDAGFMAIDSSTNIFLSTDGTNWVNQPFSISGPFSSSFPVEHQIVAFYQGRYFLGSYMYGPGAGFYILSSVDGQSWRTNFFSNITFGAYHGFMIGNGLLIAMGSDEDPNTGEPFFQISSDGDNWTMTNGVPTTTPLEDYSGAAGNGFFVLVAPPQAPWHGVLYAPYPQIYTSTDALTWTNRQQASVLPTGPTNTFSSIACNNGIYVVGTSNSIVRSGDGVVYTNVVNSPALPSVINFSNGFVGVGAGGIIYLSSDGLSWTQHNSGTASNLHGITASSNLLVAVGDNGVIQTSPTGVIWTSRTSGTSLSLWGVTSYNGLFVAVGQLGTVLTSPDGVNWSGQDSGQLTNLLAVTGGSAGFLAVGPGGTLLASADAINWTKQNIGTSVNFYSATFGNGYYLVTGNNSLAMTSPDGVTWTPRNLGITIAQVLYGAAFLNGRFDIVGSSGTILESDAIAPLFDIQIHAQGNWLTAFAPAGTNFRIQTNSDLSAPWTDAHSFNNVPAITQWTNTAPPVNQLFYRAVSP